MNGERFQEIRGELMGRLDLSRELTDEEILELIDRMILEDLREEGLSLSQKTGLRHRLFHSMQ